MWSIQQGRRRSSTALVTALMHAPRSCYTGARGFFGVSAADTTLGAETMLRVAPEYADALVLYAGKPSGGTTASICSWLGTK
jgi:hypothetical protein